MRILKTRVPLFSIIPLIFSLNVQLIAQSPAMYTGKVVDVDDGSHLVYVNIGIIGRNIGTVSDLNGNFSIELQEKFNNDSLRFSTVGYRSKTFLVREFKARYTQGLVIQLKVKPMELHEVVVEVRELKTKILGNKASSNNSIYDFTSYEPGNEIGSRIRIKKSPTFIDDFNFHIVVNNYDTLLLRLNFYDIKDGLPNNNLLNESILISTSVRNGDVKVDLSEYYITVYDDFIVCLEWLM